MFWCCRSGVTFLAAVKPDLSTLGPPGKIIVRHGLAIRSFGRPLSASLLWRRGNYLPVRTRLLRHADSASREDHSWPAAVAAWSGVRRCLLAADAHDWPVAVERRTRTWLRVHHAKRRRSAAAAESIFSRRGTLGAFRR